MSTAAPAPHSPSSLLSLHVPLLSSTSSSSSAGLSSIAWCAAVDVYDLSVWNVRTAAAALWPGGGNFINLYKDGTMAVTPQLVAYLLCFVYRLSFLVLAHYVHGQPDGGESNAGTASSSPSSSSAAAAEADNAGLAARKAVARRLLGLGGETTARLLQKLVATDPATVANDHTRHGHAWCMAVMEQCIDAITPQPATTTTTTTVPNKATPSAQSMQFPIGSSQSTAAAASEPSRDDRSPVVAAADRLPLRLLPSRSASTAEASLRPPAAAVDLLARVVEDWLYELNEGVASVCVWMTGRVGDFATADTSHVATKLAFEDLDVDELRGLLSQCGLLPAAPLSSFLPPFAASQRAMQRLNRRESWYFSPSAVDARLSEYRAGQLQLGDEKYYRRYHIQPVQFYGRHLDNRFALGFDTEEWREMSDEVTAFRWAAFDILDAAGREWQFVVKWRGDQADAPIKCSGGRVWLRDSGVLCGTILLAGTQTVCRMEQRTDVSSYQPHHHLEQTAAHEQWEADAAGLWVDACYHEYGCGETAPALFELEQLITVALGLCCFSEQTSEGTPELYLDNQPLDVRRLFTRTTVDMSREGRDINQLLPPAVFAIVVDYALHQLPYIPRTGSTVQTAAEAPAATGGEEAEQHEQHDSDHDQIWEADRTDLSWRPE